MHCKLSYTYSFVLFFFTYLLNLWERLHSEQLPTPSPPAHMQLCTPVLCVVSSCLTAKLVFTFFLLTKAFLSIIRAEAQLNTPQLDWEWVRALREGEGKKHRVEEWKLVPWIYNTRQKRCYCKRECGTPVVWMKSLICLRWNELHSLGIILLSASCAVV